MFTKTAKAYIRKLIAMRKKLIKKHLGYKNELELISIIKSLSLYLDAYDFSSHQMAGFWINHRHEIEELIPGTQAKNRDSLISEFLQLDNEAKEIKNLVAV